jgi:hypothetical protein
MLISIRGLARAGADLTGQSDDAVLELYRSWGPSQNADSCFRAYLGATCAIARHRPQLLEQLLPSALDAGISMGATTLEDFWRYAEYCARTELESTGRNVPYFTEESAEYLRNDLRRQGPLIERLIQEILALGRD